MQKQATLKNDSAQEYLTRRLREGFFIVGVAVSLFLCLSLLTYHRQDPGWSHATVVKHIANSGGVVGAWFADVFLYVFGYFALIFPLMLVYSSWQVLWDRANSFFNYRVLSTRLIGVFLSLSAGCGLINTQYPFVSAHLPYTSGGILGYVVSVGLISAFNITGATLILVGSFLTGVTFATGLSWLKVCEQVGRMSFRAGIVIFQSICALLSFLRNFTSRRPQPTQAPVKAYTRKTKPKATTPTKEKKTKPVIRTGSPEVKPSKRYQQDQQVPLFDGLDGSLPSLSLLDKAKKQKNRGYSNEKLELMSREVEQHLLDFGIEVQVVAVHPGPVITRFEMELAPGIKASKISGLAKDLARSLSVTSVRIVEVIAGKSVVGLELPNEHRQIVRLSQVLSSEQYDHARSPLSLALGNDIAGHPVIVDLAKMPHLLVAGTTGSGKSVGLNAMLLSLLYKSTPRDVRLILIDPKMLELSVYDDIPHLLSPVVTDMKEAAHALRWCVVEMERRYRLMSAMGVRNLSGFNHKVREAEKTGKPLSDPLWKVEGEEAPFLETLPYIVVVIDELADMMMVVGKKVEQLIARIAQKARAAGIHMILATQRPSVDVLTGLIKSNVPTRIAFQVSSKIDSRTILDQQGAEQLLGHGDMLYLAPGNASPVRVHGAFVDDHEVHKVTNDWKKRGRPDYIETITNGIDEQASDAGITILAGESATEDADPLYDEAVYFVTQTRKASISSVQRKFKIGYNRAARLIEEMERTGIVSAMESNGTREVLGPAPVE